MANTVRKLFLDHNNSPCMSIKKNSEKWKP
ncbi:unnamed protein product [Spirodela intermedia]|uniref:Uncharacterized protein n=1 Tax=Spirodela intermedia TaxID=51605 RepID=A0A7I8KUX4_SPIIN|nr:unnamed protein product [Spirodela intermedia]CAB1184590.1 unnamed protein product [Spirodela intermedia]